MLQGAFTVGSASWLAVHPVFAQLDTGGPDRFALVIKGGDVIDPSPGLRGQRDIGIQNGMIAALEPDIALEKAAQSIDAQGRLVMPGLVDTMKDVRKGDRYLKPVQVVRAGRPFGRPFLSPFGYP